MSYFIRACWIHGPHCAFGWDASIPPLGFILPVIYLFQPQNPTRFSSPLISALTPGEVCRPQICRENPQLLESPSTTPTRFAPSASPILFLPCLQMKFAGLKSDKNTYNCVRVVALVPIANTRLACSSPTPSTRHVPQVS